MEILYLLVPISLLLVFAIGALFWWSLRGGQFDDLEGPGYRVLMDDEAASAEKSRAEDQPMPDSSDASSK
jgi:cbb3-type cytochrome oxidase maturation protein